MNFSIINGELVVAGGARHLALRLRALVNAFRFVAIPRAKGLGAFGQAVLLTSSLALGLFADGLAFSLFVWVLWADHSAVGLTALNRA